MTCMPLTRAPNSLVDLRTGLRPTPLRRRRDLRHRRRGPERERLGLARHVRPRLLLGPGAHDARDAGRALREQGQASTCTRRRPRVRTLMIITTPFPRGPHVPRPVRTYMRPSPSTPHSYSMFPINNHIKDVSWWRFSPALLVSYNMLAGRTWQKLHKRRHHCRCASVFA